jgi:hypothetical protein
MQTNVVHGDALGSLLSAKDQVARMLQPEHVKSLHLGHTIQ